MPKPRKNWQAGPHEPLQKLSENLWWVRGPIPGVPLNRCMTVARSSDAQLVIWSPIMLDDASMRELEEWGTPAFLIAPSALHRLDAAPYKARYPGLKVLCPRGARQAVSRVVTVDGSLEDFPADAQISFRPLHGIRDREGVMLVRSRDGITVVLNDALFNMALPSGFPSRQIVQLLGSAPGPRVSRILKLLWCNDRAAFRQSLSELAELAELQRVIVAHDALVSGPAAREALRAAVSQLE